MVILRLARKAIASRPEIAAASKEDRLATINRIAAEYAKEHDALLRPRAQKIVALENDQAEPAPLPLDQWESSAPQMTVCGLRHRGFLAYFQKHCS